MSTHTPTEQQNPTQPSIGNQYDSIPLQMYVPRLEFVYRLKCEMASENDYVGAPFDGSNVRVVMPIIGGTVKGPRISGIIQHRSGADWGQSNKGSNFTRLDARYTLKTEDNHCIYVQSKGIFSPHRADYFAKGPPTSMSQKDVDWFTRLEFETGPGPYGWMNGIFAIGVLSMHEQRIIIDAYAVTNSTTGAGPEEAPKVD
ncbi:hypothetical protein BAUCODRAFT_141148 [Baudoinia panamericana UAMH 10762]|uniref:Uncharacterized protein n=1 Tax=Baudoinia panamericana (strain UAMH 10762) TaxID=717646 RepID=M2MQF4_BAUPA|nr:uncharacterized protein BAUCODRAFT_141148 [Baudoinia panamericana UAMH 10762]EMC93718.1 hypothetical protein BAUCODRAFT_141148 [Baudoinia panamericana UAMH 10762]